MDRCGIEKAVAFHAKAKEDDPKVGKAELENMNDRFISQWVVIPDTYGRFMSSGKMITEMKGKMFLLILRFYLITKRH